MKLNLKDFINTINTVSLSSINNQIVYFTLMIGLGSAAFIGLVFWDKAWAERLADSLLLTAVGKSSVTALSKYGKSKTSVKYVEAKERGTATARQEAKPEAPVVQAGNVERVTVSSDDTNSRATIISKDDERGTE